MRKRESCKGQLKRKHEKDNKKYITKRNIQSGLCNVVCESSVSTSSIHLIESKCVSVRQAETAA